MTTKKGDLVVTMIDGYNRLYIAEVVSEDPLRLKVEEQGMLSSFKDHIIWEDQTDRLQSGDESAQALLKEYAEKGNPLLSGLKSLGVEDGLIHEILPV